MCNNDNGKCNIDMKVCKALSSYLFERGCELDWISDDECDIECNIEQCLWDLGTCDNECK